MKNTKVILILLWVFSAVTAVSAYTIPGTTASAENTNFTVNVADTLAVTITTPQNGATGNPGEFLRDEVDLSIFSNEGAGFTASMHSADSTDLVHTNNNYLKTVNGDNDVIIPTLSSSSVQSAFPAGYWGYSLEGTQSYDTNTFGETVASVSSTSNYYPMTSSTSAPAVILSAASGTSSGSRSIFFGAKSTPSQPSGTYSGTVVISVVTGTLTNEQSNPNDNPITPTNPATNEDTSTTNPHYAYYSAPNRTVYTSVSTDTTNHTETTETIVSAGDTTASYANPAGVMQTTSASINSGSPLNYGLAAAAGVAATSGILFFVLAKKKSDEEEEAK